MNYTPCVTRYFRFVTITFQRPEESRFQNFGSKYTNYIKIDKDLNKISVILLDCPRTHGYHK